ncbi:MAG: hypothetical protein IJD77_01280 [Clostridia bacterium]|nr:hypothetical protein [Clostridia bacterium]
MGKKKSVLFIRWIALVIVVLCLIIAFPACKKSDSKSNLDTKFDHGYCAYYYPNGVITEADYEEGLLVESIDWGEYIRYGHFYLSTDEDVGIFSKETKENGAIEYVLNEDFQVAFNEAVKQIKSRLEECDFIKHRVSILDGIVLRVEIFDFEDMEDADWEANATQMLSLFANVGKLSFQKNGETVSELKEEGADINDIIKSVSVKTKNGTSYLKINFTSKGKDMLKTFKSECSSDSSLSTLDLVLENGTGSHKILSIQIGHINSDNDGEFIIGNDQWTKNCSCFLNSLMRDGEILIGVSDMQFAFQDVSTQTDIYKFESVD